MESIIKRGRFGISYSGSTGKMKGKVLTEMIGLSKERERGSERERDKYR